MNRIESVELLKSLKELKKDQPYNKFLVFGISKSIVALEEVLKEIQAREQSCYSEKYKTFTESRTSLLRIYSAKDEAGNPIVEGNNVKIDEDRKEEFSKATTELFDANEDILKETDEKLKAFEAWLHEEVEVKLSKVSFKYIPEEITQVEFETLSHLVKEEEIDL